MYKNQDYRFLQYENIVLAKSRSTNIVGFDCDDIAQKLRIALWEKLPKFDPQRRSKHGRYASEKTFVEWVLRSKIKDLAKFAGAKKRLADGRKESLDVLSDGGFDVAAPMVDWFRLSDDFITYGNG